MAPSVRTAHTTVTEQAYDLREETFEPETGRPQVFFSFLTAQRITQWERGDDPMTRFTFIGDYDLTGQPRKQTSVAMPRRSTRRRALNAAVVGTIVPDETRLLATHTRTVYAAPPAGVFIHDRVAQLRTYELTAAPIVQERSPTDVRAVLADQAQAAGAVVTTFNLLDASDVRLIKHAVHHYDGDAFTGLECGLVGHHGLLTRTATLVFTEETLADGYATWRPAYIGGDLTLPAGAPSGFGETLGYRHNPPEPGYVPGWYADTICQASDIQLAAPQQRGLVLRIRDPLGHETIVTPDDCWLFPATVRDPAGLTTTASYNYRIGRPQSLTDPNGTTTQWRYHPLGLPAARFIEGPSGEGGTDDRPDARYLYDLTAFAIDRKPICVRTVLRVWHASDGLSDKTIEVREYWDGIGRLVQRRSQADELAFGDAGDDVGLLVAGSDGQAHAVPGKSGGPAIGSRDPERVMVSGWQVYDNKGHVIEKYEPFFDSGWDYQPEEDARRGQRVAMYYDACGRLIRTVNPDGSQKRVIFGYPQDLSNPDRCEPATWMVTVYDENDLASRSTAPDGRPLANVAPSAHHYTPTVTVVDAPGRPVCQLMCTAAPSQPAMVT